MRMDQFTVKAQEAIAAAQTAAERADHPEVTPEHLLQALVTQEGGVVPAALAKMGVNTNAILQDTEKALGALPHTQGAATHVSPRLDAILKSALKEAESLKDDYISTEHLLLALIEGKNVAADILKRQGVTRNGLLGVLRAFRLLGLRWAGAPDAAIAPTRKSATSPSRSTGATSRRWRARASSTPSSAVTRRCAA